MIDDINTYIAECNDIDELEDIVISAVGRLKVIAEYESNEKEQERYERRNKTNSN